MAHVSHNKADYNLDITYKYEKPSQRYVNIFLLIGIILFVLGLVFAIMSEGSLKNAGHGHDAHHGGGHSQVHKIDPPLLAQADTLKHTDAPAHSEQGDGHEAHGAAPVHGGDNGHKGGGHDGVAHGAAHGHDAGHGGHVEMPAEPVWLTRLWANLLANSFFFLGIALTALFLIAVKYASMAGWYVQFQRLAEAMSAYIPYGSVLLMVIFFASGNALYDWKDGMITNDFNNLVAHKSPYLNTAFFIARNVFFALVWVFFWWQFRKLSIQEDSQPGLALFNKRSYLAPIYIVVFGLSFSAASWDWLMSLEVTWFSTMFGVYVFASCWVAMLALLTLIAMFLKEQGFLPYVNTSHFHDLARMVFGFSIFWTYIWFCQFLLIWYANIPEETTYFRNRLEEYPVMFFATFFIDFILPFLVLMSRANNRHMITLGFICGCVVVGHWIDLCIMVFPGPLKSFGTIGLLEVGTFFLFLGSFLWVTARALAQAPLIPKNHPYLMESIDHHFTS
jgi:hypothetical protein